MNFETDKLHLAQTNIKNVFHNFSISALWIWADHSSNSTPANTVYYAPEYTIDMLYYINTKNLDKFLNIFIYTYIPFDTWEENIGKTWHYNW